MGLMIGCPMGVLIRLLIGKSIRVSMELKIEARIQRVIALKMVHEVAGEIPPG